MAIIGKRIFTGLCLISALSSGMVSAATGGRIEIHGAIVESPCGVKMLGNDVELSCYTQGKVRTRQMSLRKLERPSGQFENIEQVKMSYVNPQHTAAILTVTYQ